MTRTNVRAKIGRKERGSEMELVDLILENKIVIEISTQIKGYCTRLRLQHYIGSVKNNMLRIRHKEGQLVIPVRSLEESRYEKRYDLFIGSIPVVNMEHVKITYVFERKPDREEESGTPGEQGGRGTEQGWGHK